MAYVSTCKYDIGFYAYIKLSFDRRVKVGADVMASVSSGVVSLALVSWRVFRLLKWSRNHGIGIVRLSIQKIHLKNVQKWNLVYIFFLQFNYYAIIFKRRNSVHTPCNFLLTFFIIHSFVIYIYDFGTYVSVCI